MKKLFSFMICAVLAMAALFLQWQQGVKISITVKATTQRS